MVEDSQSLLINEAFRHHGAGDLREADQLYRKVLSIDPKHPAALHFLGVIALQTGHAETAVRLIKQAVSLLPDYADAHSNLGNAQQSLGRFEDAVKSYTKALSLNPPMAETRANLGNARRQLRQFKSAVSDYCAALDVKPELPEARRNLALTLLALGQTDEALKNIVKARELNPSSPEIVLSMGNILQELGRTDAAVECYKHVLKIQPDSPPVLCNLGNVLREQGHLDDAVSHYEHALTIDPDYAEAHYNRGMAYHDAGDLDSAIGSFRHVLTLDHNCGKAHRIVANLTRHTIHDADIVAMENVLHNSSVNDEQKMHIAFGLGKSFEDLGQHDTAFSYYQRANGLRRESISFDIEKDSEVFTNIKATFSADFLSSHSASMDVGTGINSETPIFIIGMPRSGTTLVEQILASHPHVYGAGELNILPQCIANNIETLLGFDYTAALPETKSETLHLVAAEYVEKLQKLAPGFHRITDKLPMNFLNIGMIKLLLPGAQIIHCQRNPLDTCLSIYKNFFSASGHHYAYDLTELGRYYNLYLDLMEHWREVLPGGFYDIDYEELVANQETESRRLLDACGLDWDSACLQFYKTQRQVSTISAAQVRKPIYDDSIERWRSYEVGLEPLINILARH